MSSKLYRYQAKSIDGMLSQLIRYVANGGHYFYIRVRVPQGKDPTAIAERLLDRYDIRKARWQRKRRHLKDTASIHLLQYREVIVIILTKGKHEKFYCDHHSTVGDIRRTALKLFGYSIRYSYSELERRNKVFVRLDDKTRRMLEAHMLAIATWDAYRDRTAMEKEFHSLRYQPYEPVYAQLVAIAKKVNKVRRRRGFEKIALSCIRTKRRLGPVFAESAGAERAA